MARNRSSEKKQSAPKNDTTHMKSDGKTKRAQDRKNGNKTRGKRARPPGASSKHRSAKTGLKNGAKRDQIVMLQSRTLKQRIRDTQRILALVNQYLSMTTLTASPLNTYMTCSSSL